MLAIAFRFVFVSEIRSGMKKRSHTSAQWKDEYSGVLAHGQKERQDWLTGWAEAKQIQQLQPAHGFLCQVLWDERVVARQDLGIG